MMETRTTCCYCGVGCGVIVAHDGTRITGVRGDPDHPANQGRLCSKGLALHLTATPQAMRFRARTPLAREARHHAFAPVAWNTVLDELAERFAACIREHGPDSVAFYLSGQLTTEDYYVYNKLAKGLIGTNNVDTNSRLCMSSAVTAYKQTLGADAPPGCYEDIDLADLIVIAGSNAAWTHPVLYRRIEAAKLRNPALRIIAIDPRRTVTAEAADLHLAIEPGTDVALFHGLLHLLLWDECIDRDFVAAHTTGFAELKSVVREFTPRVTADICGIAEKDLLTAARWLETARSALSLYCQGLNQSSAGTAKNAALINLHLATGQIGRPGTGPFSLTGQPNAMGGREVGGMATLLSAHRDLADPVHRAEVAALWGVADVPAAPGKTAVELFDALYDGSVKMVWIACTNPAQSMPDQPRIRAALRRAELVVLQEAYTDTETAAFADVLLPAASWAEKEGTVTNSERRISRARAAVAPPGDAWEDWRIGVEFARRLEARLPARAVKTLFPYESPAQIFAEHAATTRGRDLDITGLSYALLDDRGPQHWPFPEHANAGTARLYANGIFATPDGRARFCAARYAPPAEIVNSRFPLRLTTSRLRDHWHGMSRTGTIPEAHAHAPEPAIALNPGDLHRRGLRDGDLVRVSSRRGSLVLRASASDAVRPGVADLPMHFGAATLVGGGVNEVTSPALCPQSKQPELKFAAVRVEPAALPHRLVAFGFPDDGDTLALRARLREALAGWDFGCVTLLAGPLPAVLVRAASATPQSTDRVAAIDAELHLDGADVARYDDARRGVARRVRVGGARVLAVRLSGGLDAEAWLRDWLVSGRDVGALGATLLLPTTIPPAGYRPRGPLVCTCFDVTAEQIITCAGGYPPQDAMKATIQDLRCGTNCGSCHPEVARLVASVASGRSRAPAADTADVR